MGRLAGTALGRCPWLARLQGKVSYAQFAHVLVAPLQLPLCRLAVSLMQHKLLIRMEFIKLPKFYARYLCGGFSRAGALHSRAINKVIHINWG
jgi:hypothetical protein